MQVPALHSHGHDEATQEQHVSVFHVLDTHLEGGREAPSGLSLGHRLLGPTATQVPRDRQADQMLTSWTAWRGDGGSSGVSECQKESTVGLPGPLGPRQLREGLGE